MKVKLKSAFSGVLGGQEGDWSPGDVLDLPELEARRMAMHGACALLEEPKGKEPPELEIHRHKRVEVTAITHDRHGTECGVKLAPAVKRRSFRLPPVTVDPSLPVD